MYRAIAECFAWDAIAPSTGAEDGSGWPTARPGMASAWGASYGALAEGLRSSMSTFSAASEDLNADVSQKSLRASA